MTQTNAVKGKKVATFLNWVELLRNCSFRHSHFWLA